MALSWELEALQKILEEIWQDASKRAIQAFILIRQSSHLFRFDERARWWSVPPGECEVKAAVSLSNAGWKRQLNLKAK